MPDYDVVIVGGGLAAHFAAFELLRRGLRTAIVERDLLCSGLCSKSAGIMTRQLALRGDVVASHRSFRIVEDLERESGRELIRRAGVLTISPRSRVLRRLEALYSSVGIPYKLLGPDEVSSIWSSLVLDPDEVSIYTEDDGVIDTGAVSYEMRKLILDMGGSILERCGRTGLRISSRGSSKYAEGVIAERSGCSVKGSEYLLDLGTSTTEVLTRSLGEAPVPSQVFLRCQVFFSRASLGSEMPVVYDNRSHLYIVSEARGRLIFGDGPCEIVDKPEGIAPDLGSAQQVFEGVERRLRGGSGIEVVEVAAHVCDTTRDLLPVLGRHPSVENLFLVYGLGTYGLMRSPYLGIQAGIAVYGSKPDPEVEAIGPRRDHHRIVCAETHTPLF